MAPITIIGYGNPLRGDDGLGWLAAMRCAENAPRKGINALALHQLTPELADDISRSELVIFIDANCGQEPGHLSCKLITPHTNLPGALTHQLSPAGLLAFTREFYGTLPDTAILLTVGGMSFGYGEGLSSAVQAVMPVLERILDILIGTNLSAAIAAP